MAVCLSVPVDPTRPTSVQVSFVLWIVLGVLTMVGLLGIAILVAAFFMRDGSRTGRTALTIIGVALGVPMLLGPAVLLVASGAAWVSFLMVILFMPGAAFILAAMLMWGKKASAYFRATRS